MPEQGPHSNEPDLMEQASPEDVDLLGLPAPLKKRYLKLIKTGLSKLELDALLEQNEYTPVLVSYDLKANPALSQERIQRVIDDFQSDVRSDMRAREAALLFLKGLGLAARLAARGAGSL